MAILKPKDHTQINLPRPPPSCALNLAEKRKTGCVWHNNDGGCHRKESRRLGNVATPHDHVGGNSGPRLGLPPPLTHPPAPTTRKSAASRDAAHPCGPPPCLCVPPLCLPHTAGANPLAVRPRGVWGGVSHLQSPTRSTLSHSTTPSCARSPGDVAYEEGHAPLLSFELDSGA